MIDYSRLPREELIKEIEVWRARAVDQQLVFVDDLKPYVDEAVQEAVLAHYREIERIDKQYPDKDYFFINGSFNGKFGDEKDYFIQAVKCTRARNPLRDAIIKFFNKKKEKPNDV